MIKILVIEDDVEFAELIMDFLGGRGIECVLCHDPYYAWAENLTKYSLVLLDLGLPGMDGLELCKKFRQTSSIPIIISSARGSTQDKVLGLQIGADDYLPKPYDPDELYARIISLLRRSGLNSDVKTCDFTIDKTSHEVLYMGNAINLSSTEYDIMSALVKNIGHLVSREQLLGDAPSIIAQDGKSLEVTISKIRQKLKRYSNKNHLLSIRSRGYKLVE